MKKKFLVISKFFVLLAVIISAFSLNSVKASAAYDFYDLGTWAPIAYGSSGGFVGAAQSNLWSAGESEVVGSIDKSFGPATQQATRNFQSKNGLVVDGKIGPATWALMEDYTIIMDSRSRKFTHPGSYKYITRFAYYARGDGSTGYTWDLVYKANGEFAGAGGAIWYSY